jgi:hypothetical protein
MGCRPAVVDFRGPILREGVTIDPPDCPPSVEGIPVPTRLVVHNLFAPLFCCSFTFQIIDRVIIDRVQDFPKVYPVPRIFPRMAEFALRNAAATLTHFLQATDPARDVT